MDKISQHKKLAMGQALPAQPKVDFSPKSTATKFGGNTTDNDSGDSN